MSHPDDDDLIAIVGLSCRFPGASDAQEFWANLAAGVESHEPLPAIDEFDAGFFGYSDNDAVLLDPQQRILLETCWAALEDAGHDPAGFPGMIGVYAGCSMTAYAEVLRERRHRLAFTSDRQIRLATDIDFLTTRVAYKLGLRGPAMTIMTACSTSLVAIHTASNALLAGECDMALAGGVTAHLWRHAEPDDEGLIAPDGHCRAFDAKAAGTVFADGAGVVVLKRLADAHRDTVRAVIRGSAVNNDGSAKAGFFAPGIEGQARVIRDAQLVAGVGPDSIGYVETHGTGTPLGDPIELAALTEAFRAGTAKVGYCPIGTVKTNIGHTDAAAGVAGVIKTVLAVEHGLIPPSLNFESPNPEIDFDTSPFFVATRLTPWPKPRRAGVSAFGMGGTNAHVIIEEPPPVERAQVDRTRPWRLIVQSAREETALAEASTLLAGHLRDQTEVDLADVEWTLQVGRCAQSCRHYVVGTDHASVIEALGRTGPNHAIPRRVAFAFPGLGGQHPGMGRELYAHEPEFRRWIDRCAELAEPRLGVDLRAVMFDNEHGLTNTAVSQPAVFATEYAMARLLLAWDVRPDMVVGHSLGAYAAACVADVFTLEDALALVIARGALLGTVQPGAMVAIPLPEAEVTPLLTGDLTVAVVNSPNQCVVAGAAEPIARLQARLDEMAVDTRRLQVPVPAHSPYVTPIVGRFEEIVRAVPRRTPTLPVLSELTGKVLSHNEITDPAYWSGHLRRTVRFTDALDTVFGRPDTAVFEVGPGQALTTVLRRHPHRPDGTLALPTMPHPRDVTPEPAVLLSAIGRFWAAGGTVDWAAPHRERAPRRIPLPTYPFQRRRFRVDREEGPLPETTPAKPVPATGTRFDATQERVAEVFRLVLGVAQVDLTDSFFALGGDSITASQLVRAVQHSFDLPVRLRGVFQYPTVAGLARHIDELRAGEGGQR
ncbi:type I polyketide synthase [Actinocrispum wychmicini]|uniref:Acyl transferase domain-containing protein n=1 Tax=Actinocrispum wychmicini TaxID=1213861 RepID=A0A4R2J5S4_9PSEU|nr:type I polyketide synthase [Actinocrispum wychmicini]TCO54263.1 acyl transferase domain-containing protein [Actinocrispum wychmicini]